ncbi:MAG: TatD family hydrolase [Bacteroidales bacterium]|nr:TatD family hydrolase [Bacteroidales bacterium]MCF8387555.1 TatD family hydrolase [Bacteroidales bacterium]MCF8399585.1 TatD family hydrolase [Bacteroidales bacterium]
MTLTDTHTHLYLDAFDDDRNEVVQNAIDKGIKYMLLPNIDSTSRKGMLKLCKQFPDNCFPMMGLHPTSVKENYKEELALVEKELETGKYIAVGEIGMDLYWDKTFQKEQKEAFQQQIRLALKHDLPIAIHQRDSYEEIMEAMEEMDTSGLTGVFHCFTGTREQAGKIIGMGFFLGIGGVLTFKNSKLEQVIKGIDLKHIILETDSPFLAPVPYRGKRNESTYVRLVANKLAEVKEMDVEEVAEQTTINAKKIFNF